jgi:hypothetical protein
MGHLKKCPILLQGFIFFQNQARKNMTIAAQSVQGKKTVWIGIIIGATLLLAGSVFGVDWANYFKGTSVLYPAIGKPVITLLAMILVLSIGKNRLSNRDWWLLFAAFCCMLPTDVLMSIVVVSPTLGVGGTVFMVGGVLSIIAHVFLILRVACGLPYLKKIKWTDLWLPVLIYGSAAVILVILWPDVVRVGHSAIASAYTAFFCTTMWFSWETVRHKLYPKTNAWMVAIAATCWFATEIAGEIYNLGLGNISEIVFRFVWVFYGTNVILWALSGFSWKTES